MDLKIAVENVSWLHGRLGQIADNIPSEAAIATLYQAKLVNYLGWASRDSSKEAMFEDTCKEAAEFCAKIWH